MGIVPKKDVPGLWGSIKQNIDDSLKYGDGALTSEKIFDRIMKDTMVLWLDTGTGNFLIVSYQPSINTLDIVVIGGANLEPYLTQFFDLLIPFAKDQGAKKIRINGRKGWCKYLKNYGFKHLFTASEKVI